MLESHTKVYLNAFDEQPQNVHWNIFSQRKEGGRLIRLWCTQHKSWEAGSSEIHGAFLQLQEETLTCWTVYKPFRELQRDSFNESAPKPGRVFLGYDHFWVFPTPLSDSFAHTPVSNPNDEPIGSPGCTLVELISQFVTNVLSGVSNCLFVAFQVNTYNSFE